jgi:hypothetical protein
MPSCIIARPLSWVLLMSGSAWLIARYRLLGLIISIFAGWGILVFVYSMWPAPPDPHDFDEDREDMPGMGPFVMALWCVPVYCITVLWRRQRQWLAERRTKNA